MKIAFLCGSLEPGRDGVGDYVRRLAGELVRQGHQPAGIALADQFIDEEVAGVQPLDAGALPVLRLPMKWPANQRFARAQQWLDELDPEWVSLQFVPFAFHPKGLPFRLGRQLAPLGKGRLWHLMVHELWVGMDYESPAKYIWWGRVQRVLIKSIIARLRPRVIHTQIPLYQAHLTSLGFNSQLLPLFANIPNMANTDKVDHTTTLAGAAAESKRGIELVAFGTIHPGAPIEKLARDAAQYARHHATPVTLTMVGRCGAEQTHWATAWEAAGLPVRMLGEQTPDCISATLHEASLGITTTPVALIGKSGTAAAMREHGLPILCLTRSWIPRNVVNPNAPAGIFTYQEGNLAAFLVKEACLPVYNSVVSITQQFSQDLSGV